AALLSFCAGPEGAWAKSMFMLMQQKRINAANDLTVSATLRPPTFCLILRAITSSCASDSCRSRISLRKEGEVAGLESPNGLDATAESQLRGEVSTTKFPALLS